MGTRTGRLCWCLMDFPKGKGAEPLPKPAAPGFLAVALALRVGQCHRATQPGRFWWPWCATRQEDGCPWVCAGISLAERESRCGWEVAGSCQDDAG